jgi:hypothetical protein
LFTPSLPLAAASYTHHRATANKLPTNVIVFCTSVAYPSFVQDSKLLALLNAEPARPEHWVNIFPAEERELRKFLPMQSREAQLAFRDLVHAWIASGFQPNGSEQPERRDIRAEGCLAILEAVHGLFRCQLDLPEGPIIFPLAKERYPNTGSLSIRLDPRGGIEAVPILFRGHLKPEELSAYGFYLFWREPWLFTVMRCAHCKVFALPRRTPRRTYIRGWHCERCRNTVSAIVATADARRAIRDRWLRLAVEAWLEYEQQRRRSTNDRVVFVMERVNKRLPYADRIKRNSITRNRAKIQAEAERQRRKGA